MEHLKRICSADLIYTVLSMQTVRLFTYLVHYFSIETSVSYLLNVS